MTLLALEHLRSNIIRCTANGSLTLAIKLELGGKTEVTYLYFHLIVEEKITELQISMNYAMTMQILDSSADLVDVALHLKLVEALTTAQ